MYPNRNPYKSCKLPLLLNLGCRVDKIVNPEDFQLWVKTKLSLYCLPIYSPLKCRVAPKVGWEYRFVKTKAFDVTCDKYWKRWMWVLCVDYRYRMTGLCQISVYKVHRRQSYDCNGWFQSHPTRIFLNRHFHTNPVKYNKKLECNRLVLSLCFPCGDGNNVNLLVCVRGWPLLWSVENGFHAIPENCCSEAYLANTSYSSTICTTVATEFSPNCHLPEVNKQSTTSPLTNSLTIITVNDCGRAPSFWRYHH